MLLSPQLDLVPLLALLLVGVALLAELKLAEAPKSGRAPRVAAP